MAGHDWRPSQRARERSEKSRLAARNRNEALCARKRITRPTGKRTEASAWNQIEAWAGARAPGAKAGSSESLRAQADLGSSQNGAAHSRENRRKHRVENRSQARRQERNRSGEGKRTEERKSWAVAAKPNRGAEPSCETEGKIKAGAERWLRAETNARGQDRNENLRALELTV
jgi:hypothetical protein